MREIEYRGIRLDNGEWVFGDIIHCYRKDAGKIFIKTETGLYQVDPATVGQYTGLKDRNGVKIFKGDVVTYGDDGFLTAVVRFGNFNEHGRNTVPSYSYGWFMDAIQCQGEDHAVQQSLSEYEGVLTYWPAHVADNKAGIERLKVEVIGNIHDNPELVNQGNDGCTE